MNIFKAYITGLRLALRSKRMISLIYLVTLILGLVVAVPFFGAVKEEVGNSMSVYSLLTDFDFTVFADFMLHSGDAIKPFVQQALWISAFYILFNKRYIEVNNF